MRPVKKIVDIAQGYPQEVKNKKIKIESEITVPNKRKMFVLFILLEQL